MFVCFSDADYVCIVGFLRAFVLFLIGKFSKLNIIFFFFFNVSDCRRFTRENAKDIIAVGFDVNKTFIFSDVDYVG